MGNADGRSADSTVGNMSTAATDPASGDEAARRQALLSAQSHAVELFDTVVARGLIAPGRTEKEVSADVRDLANELFDVRKFWHKRIVRAGANTLAPYDENPTERIIGDDDIVFLDFGPIFEDWEADFGRTYVLGSDPRKIALRDALEPLWHRGRAYFEATPDVTGEDMYHYMCTLARDVGWTFGSPIAGHLVGEFPHEKIAGDKISSYIAPGSTSPMRRPDQAGRQCHWILEIHLTDPDAEIGGFFEQLLDI